MSATTPDTLAVQQISPNHQIIAGIHCIKVSGSFYEMGYQHGEMLKEEARRGPLPYFRSYLEKQIRASILGAITPVIYPLVRQLVGRRVRNALPAFAKDVIKGVADGAGLPHDMVLDACTMPDSLLTVASRFIKMRKVGPAVHHRIALGLGCSSAIAWGDATADGKLYHARNFDYYSVAGWAGTTTVAFHEPDEGHKYCSVTAAGVPLGGVTAMNAAGLSMTVHQHMFTDKARLGGLPVGLVGDMIMREASNLDEAQAILEKHRPIGCWTYVVTDGKAKETLCWEENPDRNVAKRIGTDEGTFGYANIYLDKELGDTEKNLYGSYWRHNLGRHRRVHELLEAGKGEHSAQSVAEIMGDEGTSGCRINEAIAMLMTVGSVVFCPEDGTVWVGAGQAPTSQGEWIPFSFKTSGPDLEAGVLKTQPDVLEPKHEAFEEYRKAYLEYFDECRVPRSRAHMAKVLELQPEQPLYHVVAALLAIKDGDAEAGEALLTKALELGHPDEERLAAMHLWRARARDLMGERPKALMDYQAALDLRADPPVHAAAEKGVKRAYKPRQTRRISIDFSFADVITP